MSNINKERAVGFFGSKTFREVQKTMLTLPKQRQRLLYGVAVMLSGMEHLRRAISTESTTGGGSSRAEVIKGSKEIVIGAERAVDALFTGVAKGVENGFNEMLGSLKDEMQEARELRSRQVEEQDL